MLTSSGQEVGDGSAAGSDPHGGNLFHVTLGRSNWRPTEKGHVLLLSLCGSSLPRMQPLLPESDKVMWHQ